MELVNERLGTSAFSWGARFGVFMMTVYGVAMAAIHYGYLTIDEAFWSYFYWGFDLSAVGIAIGFVWAFLDGFAMGFLTAFIAEKLADRQYASHYKK